MEKMIKYRNILDNNPQVLEIGSKKKSLPV